MPQIWYLTNRQTRKCVLKLLTLDTLYDVTKEPLIPLLSTTLYETTLLLLICQFQNVATMSDRSSDLAGGEKNKQKLNFVTMWNLLFLSRFISLASQKADCSQTSLFALCCCRRPIFSQSTPTRIVFDRFDTNQELRSSSGAFPQPGLAATFRIN